MTKDSTPHVLPTKPDLQLRLSSPTLLIPISQYNGRLSPTLAADATTAVTLGVVDQAELTGADTDRDGLAELTGTNALALSRNSISSNYPSSVDDEANFEDDTLSNMLHGLMVQDLSQARDSVASLNNFNIFSDECSNFDEGFIRAKLVFDKSGTLNNFQGKLKQFFILSTAGKPIYSMNGSDDVILGYMGLLTTIVSTFQESMKTEFHHISQDGFRMVVMNKSPLLYVAMTKVLQELVPSTDSSTSSAIIENQLKILHNYLLAVLSKPVIAKNFEKRMNYDLRRILSAQDMHVLDTLSMSLTYGFSMSDEDKFQLQGTPYICSILKNALRCAKITNTSRTKLVSIMTLARKLKVKADSPDAQSILLGRLAEPEKAKYVAADLLFGLLFLEDKIINYMKPRNHDLSHEDIHTLLSTISASYKAIDQEESADLWIPLCMPNFNSSGFLYLFVKKFKVKGCPKAITISLLSSNKNSFFEMKEVAEYVISKIITNEQFSKKLASELSLSGDTKDIFKQLNITTIKHFIYKRKGYNQIYMDEIFPTSENCDMITLKAHSHILYFYSALASSKATIVKQGSLNPKKLSYTRWQLNEDWVTAFMLADEKFEFYCLCGGLVQAQEIISQSLRLIRWCERYKKRLFVGKGVTF